MNRVLVDSNVLIDVLTRDPTWHAWSAEQLTDAIAEGAACLNPIVAAEVSAAFEVEEEFEKAVRPDEVARVEIPWSACFPAGRAFRRYRREHQGQKTSPLPDFFIGAHALVAGMKLLTRDVPRYRTYFPDVELISPE